MHYRTIVSSSCLAGVIALAVCGPALAVEDAAAVCRLVGSAFEAGVASGDPVKLAATYAPDGQYVNEMGITTGREAIVKAGLPPDAKDIDTFTSSRMVGDIALCSGGYTFTFTGGPPDGIKGYWTKVVGKVDGGWKILVLTTNTTPAK
jgi:hypothetical protein